MTASADAPPRPSLKGLGAEDYRALAAMLKTRIKRHDVPSLAAAVAFKVFFSLFPAMFAAGGAFGLVFSGDEVVELLDELAFVPEGIRETIEGPLVDFVEGAGGGASAALFGGILVGLWTASSAAATLIKSLSRINGTEETRGFLTQRVLAVGIALAMFVVLVLLVLLLVAGSPVQRLIVEVLAAVELGGLAVAGFTAARYAGAGAVLVVFFAFVFWIGPDLEERPPFRLVSPGAVLGVLGWVLLSGAFGIYTNVVGEGANPAAGVFGGVIVLLLWLQLSMLVLLIGAQLNAGLTEYREQQAPQADHEPAAPGPTPPPRGHASAGAARAGPSDGRHLQERGTSRKAAVAGMALAATVAGMAWLRNRR